jgi:ferredoxin
MSKRKPTKQETDEAFWDEQCDRAWCMLNEACHTLCDLYDLDDARRLIMEEIESVLHDEVEERQQRGLQASRDEEELRASRERDDKEDHEQQLAWLTRHERIEH